MRQTLRTEVLVVGGGTGGVAAALTAARAGAQTVLVSETPWLGGMLTSAGVAAPDGNELMAWQTGLWGQFLRAIAQRQPGGLDHAWVSFFTFEPKVAADLFAEWVKATPHLTWIVGDLPQAVLRQGDRILGVEFTGLTIHAQITIDATELGDLLALGQIPHRWGWEWQAETQEPSAPVAPTPLTQTYPVQAPTWVVVLQDYGEGATAPEILPSPLWEERKFSGAWAGYDPQHFLNYGRLPGNRFMLNWPQQGNDYGVGLERLVGSPQARQAFCQEARWHAQDFACYIQRHLGRRYGLAEETFPRFPASLGGGAYALHPYYRESRRLIGLTTIQEQDILPNAPPPVDAQGHYTGIAIGNYPNDHHYPGMELPLMPKSIRWGGRWTGTPFVVPYTSLIPQRVEGFLVAEKNISVTHIANGATRLQPLVMGIGQGAGWLAATAIRQGKSPQELVGALDLRPLIQACQQGIFPFFNLPLQHPEWEAWQLRTLETFDPTLPLPWTVAIAHPTPMTVTAGMQTLRGEFVKLGEQAYQLHTDRRLWPLVTLHPTVNERLQTYRDGQPITVTGFVNPYAPWIRVEHVA
ncbi:FAD-dependent oxidoreductase [uncultured Thermosynechococcus sp.]|uniref:FAD-dependent oxidoreductase n=1 Tax=uncultured Thermosynechococcus sp. TaxID=436945 RepID=UPI0034150BC3